MDHFEQFASTANHAAFVLGNPVTKDFLLVSLATPMEDGLRDETARRGLRFCGVLGTVDGLPRSAFSEPLDADFVISIAQAYIACVPQAEIDRLSERHSARLDPSKPNDFAEFMTRLHALQDTRD